MENYRYKNDYCNIYMLLFWPFAFHVLLLSFSLHFSLHGLLHDFVLCSFLHAIQNEIMFSSVSIRFYRLRKQSISFYLIRSSFFYSFFSFIHFLCTKPMWKLNFTRFNITSHSTFQSLLHFSWLYLFYIFLFLLLLLQLFILRCINSGWPTFPLRFNARQKMQ